MKTIQPAPIKSGNNQLLLPPLYTSRIYSLVKRLAWGLFLNGACALLTLFVAEKLTDSGMFREQNIILYTLYHRIINGKNIGIFILVQLAVVPIFLVVWSLLKPRRYANKPSLWVLLLFIPLFVIASFLTGVAVMFASWSVWPPQFAR